MTFKGKLDPGPSVKERIAEYRRKKQMELDGEEDEDQHLDWSDFSKVADRFDKVRFALNCISEFTDA